MSDTPTFSLFDGELQARQTVSADGTVTYRLDGVHMRGTITFTPDLQTGQAVPDRLVIRCGTGQHLLADRLDDLPVVNGVTLIGGADQLDLTDHSWAARLQLTPRDPGSSLLAVQAVWYARAVCRHLATHYQRLDVPALHAAAARYSAGRRLADCVHQQIRPAHALWAEVGGELAAAQQSPPNYSSYPRCGFYPPPRAAGLRLSTGCTSAATTTPTGSPAPDVTSTPPRSPRAPDSPGCSPGTASTAAHPARRDAAAEPSSIHEQPRAQLRARRGADAERAAEPPHISSRARSTHR